MDECEYEHEKKNTGVCTTMNDVSYVTTYWIM